MAKQTINPGTAPTGAGGDTFRSGSAKLQANDDEIYNYLGDGTNLNKLGTAAFKNTGTQAGNVMEVGAFGLGGAGLVYENISNLGEIKAATKNQSRILRADAGDVLQLYSPSLYMKTQDTNIVVSFGVLSGDVKVAGWTDGSSDFTTKYFMRTSSNTTVDANGFLKSASPIVKVFADKIELNDEAQQQNITFEKIGVGDYLIKGSSGFAQEGWYIETPKDANGNLLVAVVYEQLENGDISVKTYDYMLNKKGRIVADIETPLDIPENRWIDLRLQELPQPEIEMPGSIAPPDFQPTGLAQAVATVMESYHDTEQ